MLAKTSTQPGRRTPLSLTGAVTKNNPNKGASNAAANGSPTSNANKQDNKLQQQKSDQMIANSADNPNKKQLPQTDKKSHQIDNKKSNEKIQNGVNTNKQQQSNDNKVQQQIKEKQQQQNGNEGNKVNEKDNKEKIEKSDKMDKSQEKAEKDDKKTKEDKKLDHDKSEKKTKDTKEKDCNEDKKELSIKNGEKIDQQQPIKDSDKKSKEENQIKNTDKSEEKIENVELVGDQKSQKRSTPIPVTPKSNSKANRSSALVNKTPIKGNEKTPQKSTSTNTSKSVSLTKREETTSVDDDIEMEPLAVESSPTKSLQPEEVVNIKITPSATSTPGKLLLSKRNLGALQSDVQLAMQTGFSPERPRSFSQISGRRSIRQISDNTYNFQSSQYRESYRRINTELDITNSSMNVTVGSEAPNNLSFSFFGRGRKRDRTSPQQLQSAIGELRPDVDISPPKRARLDMHGFFSAVSSPLSLLRNRFSKTSLQSSTPVKLQQKPNNAKDEIEVQNVSGVSVHEETAKSDKEEIEKNTSVDNVNDITLGEEAKETKLKEDIVQPIEVDSEDNDMKDDSHGKSCDQSDIKITETPLQPAVGDPMAKNKRCAVM